MCRQSRLELQSTNGKLSRSELYTTKFTRYSFKFTNLADCQVINTETHEIPSLTPNSFFLLGPVVLPVLIFKANSTLVTYVDSLTRDGDRLTVGASAEAQADGHNVIIQLFSTDIKFSAAVWNPRLM
eukprot:g69817.t1